MSFSLQPLSLMPSQPSEAAKGFSIQALQQALTLQPSMGAQAVGEAMGGPSSVTSLEAKTSLLNPLKGPPVHSDAQMKQVSKNFEAIFMRMLLKEMRNSVEKSGVMGNSRSMEFFENMKDEQMSDSLASAGGIGIGKMIYDKLKATTLFHQKSFIR